MPAIADYDFGTLVSGTVGDNYTLCWSHQPRNVRDYNVVIDLNAELIGPADNELRYAPWLCFSTPEIMKIDRCAGINATPVPFSVKLFRGFR